MFMDKPFFQPLPTTRNREEFMRFWKKPGYPWSDEPDELYWKYLDIECMMLRSPIGCWCGYIKLPKTHRFYKKSVNFINEALKECNVYEITYASHKNNKTGKITKSWFIGIDAGGVNDLIPALYFSGFYRFDEHRHKYVTMLEFQAQINLLIFVFNKWKFND